MEADRKKWNERYTGEGYLHGTKPSAFLQENLDLVLTQIHGRRALDIACGEGRNSIFLAKQGFQVTGLDISEQGLAKARRRTRKEGVSIAFHRVDLEGYTFTPSFDLILNINFLLRELFPVMVAALAPGGIALVETILDAPQAPPTSNRLFLLQPGELARIFNGFAGTILHSSELPNAPLPRARLIFRKSDT